MILKRFEERAQEAEAQPAISHRPVQVVVGLATVLAAGLFVLALARRNRGSRVFLLEDVLVEEEEFQEA